MASDVSTPILIAARPGLMRDSLLAFLRAIPRVEVVALVDGPVAVLAAVRRRRPRTLIVDVDLPEDTLLALVRRLKVELPALNSVLLVSNLQQQRAFLAAGAGHVLLKGRLDDRLRTAVYGQRPRARGQVMSGLSFPCPEKTVTSDQ